MAYMVYGMLNVAKTALMTQQQAINVTGNNIANVNTPGYSRQRLNMEQNEAVYTPNGSMGTGVTADKKIQRIYDSFLNAQITDSASELGRWEAQKQSLDKVELMFDEASGFGLSDAMSKFWNAWQDLSNSPEGYTERAALVTQSQDMTDTFNRLYNDIQNIQEDTDIGIKGAVTEINTLVAQIAELNGKVTEIELDGHNANSYRDERDLLMKELSSNINATSFEDSDGNLIVSTSNGKPLVDRQSYWLLSTTTNASGFEDVNWVSSSGTVSNITSDITGGKLKGWIETRDVLVPDYLTRLDTLAQTMMTQVNTVHAAGFALDGSQNNFFTGTGASGMAVNSAVIANPNLVAAAAAAADLPGDNTAANTIANLQNSLLMSTNTATFDEFYNGLVGDVGTNVSFATMSYDYKTSVSEKMDNYREEVSGVSMDEEMVNLVKFQNAYNAAAKLVTTVDEMLETLIAMV